MLSPSIIYSILTHHLEPLYNNPLPLSHTPLPLHRLTLVRSPLFSYPEGYKPSLHPPKQEPADANKQIGTSTPSVAEEVAAVQQLMQVSGLEYSMHSAGTTVGPSSLSLLPCPFTYPHTYFPPCQLPLLDPLSTLRCDYFSFGGRNLTTPI